MLSFLSISSAFGFNPIYTYKGEGNAYRSMLGGVTAKNGDTYYVSYPPFAFIYLYYTSQLFGGPSVFSTRMAALSIHLISAILLFYLIGAIRSKSENNTFNFAGVIAAGFYIFAQGNLWFHGNLYFSDMVVQPLFIAGILLTIKYIKGNYTNEKIILLLFFLIFFLAAYTEWLGLFSAFFTGLIFLVLALLKKKKKWLRPFFAIALGSSLALGLTIYQYSSIYSWEVLKATSEIKYNERSGLGEYNETEAKFSLHDSESFDILTNHFNHHYASLVQFFVFCFATFILFLILRQTKWYLNKKPIKHKRILLVLILMVLPILTHYLLFYNFNTMHYFSGLKSASFVIVLSGIFISVSTSISASINRYVTWGLITFLSVLFSIKANKAIDRYLTGNKIEQIDYDRIASAKIIAKYGKPNLAIFTNTRLSPEQVYYAHHNVYPIKDNDTLAIVSLMKTYQNNTGQYYHHHKSKLLYLVTFELNKDKLLFLDTLVFN